MQCLYVKFQLLPLPSFVRAAVFGIIIELSETLVELSPDSTLLQVRHGYLVLLLNKGLRKQKGERGGMKFEEFLINSSSFLQEINTYHCFYTIRVFQPCVGIADLSSMVVIHLLQIYKLNRNKRKNMQSSFFGIQTWFSWQRGFSYTIPCLWVPSENKFLWKSICNFNCQTCQ